MITLYRPAYFTAPRAPSFAGRSIDIKPVDVPNGTRYKEIDTGRVYCFDKENKMWYEMPVGGTQ
nr:MAG TPA: Heavy-metal resistance protein CzcE [Caudoviricetes sp.]